tara:strand:- start:120 stop:839 length:720 start_codon:yes stop_codon:yes gene_type:complete
MSLIKITRKLSRQLAPMTFGEPVTHVYNPVQYARKPHETYLERYGQGRKRYVFVGMNPGPWGMAQTGVPFGEINLVRDWLGIDAEVRQPKSVHPKRPIEGFACERSEVSGSRLWGWARERFGDAESFFEDFFVLNYCPLVFMEASGKNRTPDKLSAEERDPLTLACDGALKAMVEALAPELVIGVGVYAETSAKRALEGLDVEIGRILHPSPASPAANRGWAAAAEKQLGGLGVVLPSS